MALMPLPQLQDFALQTQCVENKKIDFSEDFLKMSLTSVL